MRQDLAPVIGICQETGVLVCSNASRVQVRQWISDLCADLLALPESQKDFKDATTHAFLPGVYMRTLLIPKGQLLIGKPHAVECLNIVSKGRISVLTEAGAAIAESGAQAKSSPGTQKVGVALEDTVYVNVFSIPLHMTGDIAACEEYITEAT